MKVVLPAVLIFMLLIGVVFAGSLGKYSDEPLTAPATQPQLSPSQVKQRLNEKMKQAITVLNNMDPAEREEWVQRYEARHRQALQNKNYLEAAYYRGILDAVE